MGPVGGGIGHFIVENTPPPSVLPIIRKSLFILFLVFRILYIEVKNLIVMHDLNSLFVYDNVETK